MENTILLSSRAQIEALHAEIFLLKQQLRQEKQTTEHLEASLAQAVMDYESAEGENLALIDKNHELDCENQFLFEKHQELATGLLLEDILAENERLRSQPSQAIHIPYVMPPYPGSLSFRPMEASAVVGATQTAEHLGMYQQVMLANERLQAEVLQLKSLRQRDLQYSSKISTDITQRPNFVRAVLGLPSEGLETTPNLTPIQGRIIEGDMSEYYRQFLPYILEEVRAEICAQRNLIAKKGRLPFLVNLKSASKFIDEDDDSTPRLLGDDGLTEIQLTFWAERGDLPKLDHGFFNEAVLIVTTSLHQRMNQRRLEKQDDTTLDGILAIATAKPNYDDDDRNKRKKIDIVLTLPKQDYQERIASVLQESSGKLWLHWLCGLTPSERMYEVCVSMPSVVFQRQFLQAELLPWPDLPLKMESQKLSPALARLNELQVDVVERLHQVESGLWFLMGPPGTGKTTTAISWLMQYVELHSTQRILVCAPSNQAVRVLLKEAMAHLSHIPMALTGIAKNLPDTLRKVYVHGYAGELLKPLISHKRVLEQANTAKKLTDIMRCLSSDLDSMVNELRDLLAAPCQMTIKYHVRTGLERFQSELFFHVSNLKLTYQQFLKNNEVTDIPFIDLTERIIESIQRNAFYLESFMLQRAQIVFSTLISAGRKGFRKQIDTFSAVLIDEAAQALVPEILIPLYFSPTLYIQIGDPNQLPATITSQAARNKGYENSMMHWLLKEYDQPHEMLKIQYRMDDEICRWISRQYYKNQLVTAPAVTQRRQILRENTVLAPMFKRASIFFDIRGVEDKFKGSDLTKSSSNLIEAMAVINMVCYLIIKCKFHPSQIGVITFYSEQLRVLYDSLRRVFRDESKYNGLEMNTVDGFQGGEKDIILVSVVRTVESVGFLNDWRRLNVAMSRARHGRWIFGMFEPLNRSNSDLPSLLSECRANDGVITEEQFKEEVRNQFSVSRSK